MLLGQKVELLQRYIFLMLFIYYACMHECLCALQSLVVKYGTRVFLIGDCSVNKQNEIIYCYLAKSIYPSIDQSLFSHLVKCIFIHVHVRRVAEGEAQRQLNEVRLHHHRRHHCRDHLRRPAQAWRYVNMPAIFETPTSLIDRARARERKRRYRLGEIEPRKKKRSKKHIGKSFPDTYIQSYRALALNSAN